jgi:hypothetical protein
MASLTLLERMVDPIGKALTPAAARAVLAVRADEETQDRIDELADRRTEGSLSPEERAEYQEFVSVFNLLALLQSRARTVLQISTGQ